MTQTEVDVTQLPDGVVVAWGVVALDTTGSDGESVATVVLDLQFQLEPGMVGRQAFLLHKSDAQQLRADLKNPQTQETQQ